MAVIVIFVEGADTEPDPLPVYFLDNEEHAARICEGIGATEYRAYKFSFCEVGKADQSKFPFWAEMTIDARDGIYGEIVAGIYDTIDRAYAIISQRRSREKYTSGEANSDSGDSVKRQREISQLVQETPHLDTESIDWLQAKEIAGEKSEGVNTGTLAKYRLESEGGVQTQDKMLGKDKDGRVWRRIGTPTSHPWYLRKTLIGKLRITPKS